MGTVLALTWVGLGVKVALAVPLPYYTTFWLPDARLTAMLAGALLVTLHDQGRLSTGCLQAWPLALAAGLLLQVNLVPDVLKYTLGSLLVALGCAGLARVAGPGARWLGHPVLVAFGTVSYSLYLWQQLFYADKGLLGWPVAADAGGDGRVCGAPPVGPLAAPLDRGTPGGPLPPDAQTGRLTLRATGAETLQRVCTALEITTFGIGTQPSDAGMKPAIVVQGALTMLLTTSVPDVTVAKTA